jgi:hypothetical protein
MKRISRILAVGALSAALVGVGGVGVGTAGAGSGEVGYTVGFEAIEGGIECDFFSVDLATGVLTRINDPLTTAVECADGLTFAPDGTLYAFVSPVPTGFSNSQLVTIDLATGAQTVIGNLPPVLFGTGGMTFDGAGNLWLYGTAAIGVDPDCSQTGFEACLWQVNPADASTTFVGATTDRQVFGLAATCTDVYAIQTPIPGGFASGTEIARVDTATAALDVVVEANDVVGPEGLDFDFAGGLWALARQPDVGLFSEMNVASIDLTSGASTSTQITLEGEPFVGFLYGLAVSPISCPVPEPVVLTPTFTG